MRKYERESGPWLAWALICTLISSLFAVALQFFKGGVLDRAIAGEGAAALGYGLALGAFILGEVGFFYLYRRLGDRFAAGCVTALKQDVFESVLRRDYVAFKGRTQGEYAANTPARRTPSAPGGSACCRCFGRSYSKLCWSAGRCFCWTGVWPCSPLGC